MGRTEVSHHSYRRLDDSLEGIHLAGFTDASLKDTYLGLLLQTPHRQRYSYLGVPRTGRTRDIKVGRQQLVEPLLDNRLSVAARDADHRNIEFLAVALGQPLQGLQGRGHFQVVGVRFGILGHLADYKTTYTASVEFGDIAVTVVLLCPDGKEERGFREHQRTAVGQQPVDVRFSASYSMCTNKGSNGFYGISHIDYSSRLYFANRSLSRCRVCS